MNEGMIFDFLRKSIWVATEISFPILAVSLIVGLAIGLLQSLTSIQEMTLTFVPKLAAILAVFGLSMGFMADQIVSFFVDQIVPAVASI